MRSLHSYNTICVLATVHIWSCKLEWYTSTVILQGLYEIFAFFLKIYLGTCNLSLVQYIYETVIVPDIKTRPKHVYRVMWVHIVILWYLYCHHHNGYIFFRHDTIFSVARSISDMCLSFIWIFQSILCRNMMLSSCSPVQNIYITVMPNNLMFCDRCFM